MILNAIPNTYTGVVRIHSASPETNPYLERCESTLELLLVTQLRQQLLVRRRDSVPHVRLRHLRIVARLCVHSRLERQRLSYES